jgi:hypothetical protein
LSNGLPVSPDLVCATGTVDPLRIPWCIYLHFATVSSQPIAFLDPPTAAILFFVSGFRWRRNDPAPRPLVADHTFDPKNLSFFCCVGYPGSYLGVAGSIVLARPEPLVALGLPMRTYLLHVSFLPKSLACFSAAFATAVNLFCTHCKTKQWPMPQSLLHKNFSWSSTGSGNPGLFRWSAAGIE